MKLAYICVNKDSKQMINHGFIKVATAIPNVKVADTAYNTDQILKLTKEAADKNVRIVCFPELSITSYTCADLFFQNLLIEQAEESVKTIANETKGLDITIIVGAPIQYNNRLYNCAIVVNKGEVKGIVPKSFLPNNNEFYEKRWFSSGTDVTAMIEYAGTENVMFGTNLIFGNKDARFAIEICEDLWLPQAPSLKHTLNGAQMIFNLSASNEVIGKDQYRKQLVSQQSGRCLCAYIYAGSGFGESSTDLVFSGVGLIYENGSLLAQAERFSTEPQLTTADVDIERLNVDRLRSTGFIQSESEQKESCEYNMIEIQLAKEDLEHVERTSAPLPFVPSGNGLNERCEEIFNIQVWGLATRLHHTGIKKVVVGISGGLDSTLALLVCVRTFDKLKLPRKNIIGITMPGFGTTHRTHNNSLDLMESLGVESREIDIKAASYQHLKDINHDLSILDVTYENTQARERTQILMDVANKEGGLVVGTGDLSELALGWATYNGDHMSMYAVNTSIPKTLVRSLVKYVAETQVDNKSKSTLLDVVDTPVSPELLPADDKGEIAQKTEDIVGPYELHDFILYNLLRFGFSPAKIYFMEKRSFAGQYDNATILKWMKIFYRRFFQQQFKRSCMPDGPKVGSVNFSPRGDWRMPSDASANIWQKQIETLEA